MTDSRWPILGIGDDATEAEIRRAYAAQLRAQGPDASVASFSALRAQFEAALADARARAKVDDAIPARDQRSHQNGSTGAPDPHAIAGAALAAIRRHLAEGDLVGACDRYDRARAASEIGFDREPEIELELAHSWLANTTLDVATMAQIARRYRWDDAVGTFALGGQIVEKLHADADRVSRPGERFIGQWNWGAFALTPFWLMAHGRARLGVRELLVGAILLAVPLGFFAVLWFAIGYGRRGNAIALQYRTFRDEAHFVAVQNVWRNWGITLIASASACAVIAIVAVAAAGH